MARARDHVSLNTLVLGAWALLLHRLSGENDIVFAATRTCRHAFEGADRIIGPLINTLPLRVDVNPDQPLRDWLQELRRQTTDLRAVRHTPLIDAQAYSDVATDHPLFETIVVYDRQNLNDRLHELGGAWTERTYAYQGQTNYPPALVAYGGTRLSLRIEYDRDRFSDASGARILAYLETLLTNISRAAPEARVGSIDMLPEQEAQSLVTRGQAPTTWSPAGTLYDRFDAVAPRFPDRIAATLEGASLTNHELGDRSNAFARMLRDRGIGRNDLVGVGELWNIYGLIETTVWSTPDRVLPGNNVPTIGRPMANTQVYVVNRAGLPQPVGVAG